MTKTTGKQALVDVLRREGVEYVFGIPGATEIHFMDALEQAPEIKYVLGLHEVVCAGMAEGYARASGKPGFLNLHTGPGLAAATPLLYNAQAGHVPLVVTVGQNDSRILQHDPHLSGDLVGLGKIFAKWATEVVHAQDLPLVLQRAFKIAQQPPMGPVLVSIPQDVLTQELEYEPRPNTVVHSRLRPDADALAQAVEILAAAERPLLLVESGVARSEALDEVVELAELTGARVYQGWMSDVNFPVSHPQYLGDFDASSAAAPEVLKGVDVLVAVGCSVFAESFWSAQAPSLVGTKIVHIDDDPWEIGKNYPADCGLQGDIKTTLAELNAALQKAFSAGTGGAVAGARERARRRAEEIAWETAAARAKLKTVLGGRARREAHRHLPSDGRDRRRGQARHSDSRRLLVVIGDAAADARSEQAQDLLSLPQGREHRLGSAGGSGGEAGPAGQRGGGRGGRRERRLVYAESVDGRPLQDTGDLRGHQQRHLRSGQGGAPHGAGRLPAG